MKCFYHKSDLDGHCAGAIVKRFNPDCEMIGVDYSDRLCGYSIKPGEIVYVVDFSFPYEDMVFLRDNTNLIWIDHHKTAIDELPDNIKGLRFIGLAGCELTWMFFVSQDRSFASMPTAVMLLGRWDVWDHERPNVREFQYGMRLLQHTLPGAVAWWTLLDNTCVTTARINTIIRNGRKIYKYEQLLSSKVAKDMAFEVTLNGAPGIAMNRSHCESNVFDGVYDSNKHDFMVLFSMVKNSFKYTLYADKPGIDVSHIAKSFGGGGHAGAAGFYSELSPDQVFSIVDR